MDYHRRRTRCHQRCIGERHAGKDFHTRAEGESPATRRRCTRTKKKYAELNLRIPGSATTVLTPNSTACGPGVLPANLASRAICGNFTYRWKGRCMSRGLC